MKRLGKDSDHGTVSHIVFLTGRESTSRPKRCCRRCHNSSKIDGIITNFGLSRCLRNRFVLLLLLESIIPLLLRRGQRLPPVVGSTTTTTTATTVVAAAFSSPVARLLHRQRLHSGAIRATRNLGTYRRHIARESVLTPATAVGPTLRMMSSDAAGNDDGSGTRPAQRLVLVGGGHAHVQVIKALNRSSRPRDMSVTLIDMQRDASYSGMVPGCVSGLYRPEQTLIRLGPLAKWAGMDFLRGEVVDIDPMKRLLFVKKRKEGGEEDEEGVGDGDDDGIRGRNCNGGPSPPPATSVVKVPFDAVSFDIGSTTRGLREEWRRLVIPTRPISDLVHRIQMAEGDMLSRSIDHLHSHDGQRRPSVQLIVVGGGAAGIELSLAMRTRWGGPPLSLSHSDFTVTLLDSNDRLVPAETDRCRSALSDELSSRHIEVRHEAIVADVRESLSGLDGGGEVELESGEVIPFTHCLWATGAAPHRLSAITMAKRGVATDDRGWIRVCPTLQSVSHPHIFAAGDCASIEGLGSEGCERPSPPKAGVYAVRAGPVLIENLTAFLADLKFRDEEGGDGKKDRQRKTGLTEYDPQDDFLKLIMCGDGTAIGFRFGLPLRGRWVWKLKDRIDTTFMDLFDERYLPQLKDDREGDDEIEAELKEEGGSSYDTSQYDEVSIDGRRPQLDPAEAGELMLRTDDDVDYEAAWNVLRDMKDDEDYRSRVLERIPRSRS